MPAVTLPPTVALFDTIDPLTWGNVVRTALNAMPWGTMGSATVTINQLGINTITDLNGLTVTFTAVAGRRYRTTIYATIPATHAGDLAALTVADGSNNQLAYHTVTTPAVVAGTSWTTVTLQYIEAPAAGSHTRKARLQRLAGVGTVGIGATATSPSFILVEDLGAP